MRVFANIDALEKEKPAYCGLGKEELANLCDELRRVVKDLIPLRKSDSATKEYYQKYLCPDDNREWARKMKEMQSTLANISALTGVKTVFDEYQPSQKEVSFSEEIFHPALTKVLEDDRYSFGHIYWHLCSRYNRQIGFAFYNDIVVSDKVIEYAVDFDVDEMLSKYHSIGDAIDRLDYIDIRLIESKKFGDDDGNELLAKLKKRFEDVANYVKALSETRLSALEKSVNRKAGQVKEVPRYADSIGYIEAGRSFYLTYYDFSKCPVDLNQYPFTIHLGSYQITRTERGLEDASPILKDILQNVYKQVGFAGSSNIGDIVQDTRDLLRTLQWNFYEDCIKKFGNDFDSIITHIKWWSLNTTRCIDHSFNNEVLPAPLIPVPGYDVPNYRGEAWKKCSKFKKLLDEYCVYLAVDLVMKIPFHPYKEVHSVIPFNYYGEDYAARLAAASKKRLKTEKDRVVTDYLVNCQNIRPYLEGRLAQLDGKDINDPESVDERHRIANDLIEMANSYLDRLEGAGITDSTALKFGFEFWIWIVRCTLDYIIRNLFIRNNHELVPSEEASNEDAIRINNTGRQYTSFHKLYNVQMVHAQRDFYSTLTSTYNHKPVPKDDDTNELSVVDLTEQISEEQEGYSEEKNPQSDESEDTEFHLSYGPRATEQLKPYIRKYLHDNVGAHPGARELRHIVALVDGNYITLPSLSQIEEEFESYRERKSTISTQLSSTGGRLIKRNRSRKLNKVIDDLLEKFEEGFESFQQDSNPSKV